MTTRKYLYGIMAGLLLTAAGCADNNPWSESGDTGGLRPSVTVDAAVGAAVTRAQMESVPEGDIPSANDFTLEITKVDGSYSKSWSMAEYDPQSVALRSGRYVVTARYGDPGDEGTRRPYFVGSQEVTVKAGETSPVNIEASLGNALIEVTETDNFLGYFSTFNLQLHSGNTGAYVDVPKAQTDPTYVHPGEVAVVLSYTNWEGKSATVRPVQMKVEAAKYYHVKLDLNSETSGGTLIITFDNGVEEEEVDVDLSAVENAPEPEVTASIADTQALLQGTRCPEAPKFLIKAPAGIGTAALTLVSDPAYTFSYAGENLCSLDADGQAAVEAAGIKTIGLFKNPDKMAEIDLSGFAAQLPAGTHEVTLTVTDAFTREASATLSFQVVGREFCVKSVDPVAYAATELGVTVSYNGDSEDLKNYSYSVTGDNGSPESVTVKSVAQKTQNTAAFASNDYTVILEGVPSMRCERGIWVRAAGESVGNDPDITVEPTYPQYTVESDAFAKRAYVKVQASDLSTVMNNLRYAVFLNNQPVTDARFDWDPATGIITITGLQPDHDYKLAHSLDYRASSDNMLQTAIAFKTEKDAGVPNGDFENLKQTISYNINQGGPWTITKGGTRHQTTVSVSVEEPVSWASNNLMTTSGSDNTWFRSPTVYSSNIKWTVHQPEAKALGIGQSSYDETPGDYSNITANSGTHCIIIRNVAWDPNGSSIDKTNQTGNTDHYSNYYNSSNPPSVSKKAVGKLFLGSYSYSNGVETYNEGMNFSSRPSKLCGFYKFENATSKEISDAYKNKFEESILDSDEKAKVVVSVLSGSKVIASGEKELPATAEYVSFEVPLNGVYAISNFGLKATSVKIKFMSSNRSDTDVKVGRHQDKQEQCYRGATLTIDNLTFNYE